MLYTRVGRVVGLLQGTSSYALLKWSFDEKRYIFAEVGAIVAETCNGRKFCRESRYTAVV